MITTLSRRLILREASLSQCFLSPRNSFTLKSVFEKLRFRDGSLWTICQTSVFKFRWHRVDLASLLSFLICYRYGEKVPVDVVSRLITIVWIVIGLVLISIFLATLTVSLTVIAATENRSALYGAKVCIIILRCSSRLNDKPEMTDRVNTEERKKTNLGGRTKRKS